MPSWCRRILVIYVCSNISRCSHYGCLGNNAASLCKAAKVAVRDWGIRHQLSGTSMAASRNNAAVLVWHSSALFIRAPLPQLRVKISHTDSDQILIRCRKPGVAISLLYGSGGGINYVCCDICSLYRLCVYHLWFVCVFSLGYFLSSRVTGACPVTTDFIVRDQRQHCPQVVVGSPNHKHSALTGGVVLRCCTWRTSPNVDHGQTRGWLKSGVLDVGQSSQMFLLWASQVERLLHRGIASLHYASFLWYTGGVLLFLPSFLFC